DLDMEPVAGFVADELHQLARVPQVTRSDHPGGQVAPQRDQPACPERPVQLQQPPDLLARAAHAGDVGRRVEPVFALEAADRFRRMAQRGPAGTEGDADVFRRGLRQPPHGTVELGALRIGLGWVELEAEGNHGRHAWGLPPLYRFIAIDALARIPAAVRG